MFGYLLQQVKQFRLGELTIVVGISEIDEGLGIEHAANLTHSMVAAQSEADHLGHLQQLELPVLVLVKLGEELLDHHSQLLVAHAHLYYINLKWKEGDKRFLSISYRNTRRGES